MIIKPILIATLETALNRYLSFDSKAGDFLRPLAGKVVAVTIYPFSETLYLCPSVDGIQILDIFPGEPDTQLTGSIWSLGMMGFSHRPMQTLFSGKVTIKGDSNTGRKFQALFTKLDINLEDVLAPYVGSLFAQQFSDFLSSTQNWSQNTLSTLTMNTTEFLHEESKDLPPATEINIYYRQIDKLRSDFDRLNSRIIRLENLLAMTTDSKSIDYPET